MFRKVDNIFLISIICFVIIGSTKSQFLERNDLNFKQLPQQPQSQSVGTKNLLKSIADSLSLIDDGTNPNDQIEIDIPIINDGSFLPQYKKTELNTKPSDFIESLLPKRDNTILDDDSNRLLSNNDDFLFDDFDTNNAARYYPVGVQPIIIKFTEISRLEPVSDRKSEHIATTTTTLSTTTKSNSSQTATVAKFLTTTLRLNTTNSTHNETTWSTKTPIKKPEKDLFSSSGEALISDIHKNLKEFRTKVGSAKYAHELDDFVGKSSSERLIQKRIHAGNGR